MGFGVIADPVTSGGARKLRGQEAFLAWQSAFFDRDRCAGIRAVEAGLWRAGGGLSEAAGALELEGSRARVGR
ncbi:hypothetical protein [Nocardia sp. NPDC004604]|uniref:hypothetical protein n=1 Tax=Nocardia sp. NPDC004604 TaxID=3157013 RepID=UPI0033AA7BAA